MFQTKDHFEFSKHRRGDSLAPPGTPGRCEGMPPEFASEMDWRKQVWDAGNPAHAVQLFDNPLAVTEAADGTNWENDVVGAAGTITFDVNGHPPFFRIQTPAVDGQGHQMQASVGTRELIDFSDGSVLQPFELFMGLVARFTDAADDDDTVEQMRFFFGAAPIDTSILTAVDDAVGLYSGDASGNLSLVSDDDSGDLGSYTNTKLVQDLSTGSGAGDNTNVSGEWFQAGFKLGVLDQTNNAGYIHGFFYSGRKPSPGHFPPFVKATMALAEVPDQPLAPTLAFATGEGVLKRLDVAKIVVGTRYLFGV